jgi:hypothetical protein
MKSIRVTVAALAAVVVFTAATLAADLAVPPPEPPNPHCTGLFSIFHWHQCR